LIGGFKCVGSCASQSVPGCEIASGAEHSGIRAGDDRADARHRHQSPSFPIAKSCRKEQFADDTGEKPEHREIKPFQRITDSRGNDDVAAHQRHGLGLHYDPFV
jgi:hypothetical protein